MGIVEEDIARVRAATDFVAVASEHVALRKVGLQWTGLCPFHTEKSPSFSLNPQLGLYHCHGCQVGGDVITFVRDLLQLDFREAVEYLAGRAGIALRYDDNAAASGEHQRRTRIHELLERAVEWYHQRLLSAPDARAARAYLRAERGYDGDVVRQYRLGWAPESWDALLKAMDAPPAALVDAGLAQRNDRGQYRDFFRGRVLFPIFDASGKPIGAGGRILPGGHPPKYKNTAGTAVYDKSNVLYGLNWAKKAAAAHDRVVVCEGYTDVLGLHRAGVEEAVAACGTALADGHIRVLTRFARRIVLAYDADGAGQAAAEKVYAWEQRFEVDIRVAALPPGDDPADLARRDPAALGAAIEGARPFLEFMLDRHLGRADLTTAEGRVRAATGALALIGAHPNELVRDQYVMTVADRCRIAPDRLRAMPADATALASGPSRSAPDPPAGPPVVRSMPPAELAALRLAVHRPGELAERIDRVLFADPLARAAFDALAGAGDLHEAVEGAATEVGRLLSRLAVESCDEGADDVMVRLLERGGRRAIDDLQVELRAETPASQAEYAATIAWLKQAAEALRPADGSRPEPGAEQGLLAWLVDRDAYRRERG